ncbi:MAG: DNA methyltransferase [Acidobacteriota bacterium]
MPSTPLPPGRLFYGDNLQVMREALKDASVDLIYLDPPFNSKRDYNLLFKTPKGHKSDAQITAFYDSWHWGEQAEREFDELLHQPNTDVAQIMRALRGFLGENDMMAYLTMMANRLLELYRVLKTTGSLYLHCDPTASHYLKIVLDGVFGKQGFENEIIWKRTTTHSDSKTWSRVADTIFFYTKSDVFTWNTPREEHSEDYLASKYRHDDNDGRGVYRLDNMTSPNPRPNMMYVWKGFPFPEKGWRYEPETMAKLDEEGRIWYPRIDTGDLDITKRPQLKRYLNEGEGGGVMGTVWTDISPINSQAQERLGYPTQKPLALLERIIAAGSKEDDVVLDPFCGCGTAVHAAQKLNRQWVGIDITHLAISLIEKRLKTAFGTHCKFDVLGTPQDLEAARDLAERNKYQYQWWAVSLVDAQPYQGRKKGPDGGVDGIKFFRDLDRKEVRKIVVSVKGSGLKADDVRALNHVREREGAEIALFISLEKPTAGMLRDAAAAGLYTSYNDQKFPRVQLLTIENLLAKAQRAEHPDYEPDINFKRAASEPAGKQGNLDL